MTKMENETAPDSAGIDARQERERRYRDYIIEPSLVPGPYRFTFMHVDYDPFAAFDTPPKRDKREGAAKSIEDAKAAIDAQIDAISRGQS